MHVEAVHDGQHDLLWSGRHRTRLGFLLRRDGDDVLYDAVWGKIYMRQKSGELVNETPVRQCFGEAHTKTLA